MIGTGFTHRDLRVLDQLMKCSVVRGDDATGIATGNIRRNNVKTIKFPINAHDFRWYTDKKEDDFLANLNHHIWIGHTRAATSGSLKVEGAQPFDLQNITGCHNGGLGYNIGKYHSDSHRLLSEIDTEGLQPALNRTFTNDAYALTWYDKRDKLFRMIHNGRREFSFCILKDRPVMFWASEEKMLRWILDRNGGEYVADYYVLEPHWLMEVDAFLVNNKDNKKSWKITKDVKRVLQTIPSHVNRAHMRQASMYDEEYWSEFYGDHMGEGIPNFLRDRHGLSENDTNDEAAAKEARALIGVMTQQQLK